MRKTSTKAALPSVSPADGVRVERYKRGRHWAVYEGAGLLAVTVYKKGAVAVAARIREAVPGYGGERAQPGPTATGRNGGRSHG